MAPVAVVVGSGCHSSLEDVEQGLGELAWGPRQDEGSRQVEGSLLDEWSPLDEGPQGVVAPSVGKALGSSLGCGWVECCSGSGGRGSCGRPHPRQSGCSC